MYILFKISDGLLGNLYENIDSLKGYDKDHCILH